MKYAKRNCIFYLRSVFIINHLFNGFPIIENYWIIKIEIIAILINIGWYGIICDDTHMLLFEKTFLNFFIIELL